MAVDAHMQTHYGETMLKRRAMANYEYREKVKKAMKEAEEDEQMQFKMVVDGGAGNNILKTKSDGNNKKKKKTE